MPMGETMDQYRERCDRRAMRELGGDATPSLVDRIREWDRIAAERALDPGNVVHPDGGIAI